MNISDRGIELIQEFEGFRAKAYKDPVGIVTIGFGTTRINGRSVELGETCSREEATEWMRDDLDTFVSEISRLIKVPVNQNQFDAITSLAYNVGSHAISKSTLLRKLNAGDYVGAAAQFPRWNKAGGKVLAGLTRRRRAEMDLFNETVDTTVSSVPEVDDVVSTDYDQPKGFIGIILDLISKFIK